MVDHTSTFVIDQESVRLLSPGLRDQSLFDKSFDATDSTTSSTVASGDSTSSTELDSGVTLRLRSKSRSKSVIFSTVQVREYDQVVGDHTDLIGPPLSIGWKYQQRSQLPIAEYEEKRPPRRSQMEILITPTGRRQILIKNWGYTSQELSNEEKLLSEKREKEVKEEHKQRGLMCKMGKKIKRSMSSVTAAVALSGSYVSSAPSVGGSPFSVVASFSGA